MNPNNTNMCLGIQTLDCGFGQSKVNLTVPGRLPSFVLHRTAPTGNLPNILSGD